MRNILVFGFLLCALNVTALLQESQAQERPALINPDTNKFRGKVVFADKPEAQGVAVWSTSTALLWTSMKNICQAEIKIIFSQSSIRASQSVAHCNVAILV
ncbi:MAG: hypothetical protein ACRC2T_05140 [Thermoguttaceae bacterium]